MTQAADPVPPSPVVETEDTVVRAVNTHLALLPAPLKFKQGPLLVTIETWSDGVTQARWPETALYGEGASDALALDALRERIAEFAQDMVSRMARATVKGPLLQQWGAFVELIDVSGLAEVAR